MKELKAVGAIRPNSKPRAEFARLPERPRAVPFQLRRRMSQAIVDPNELRRFAQNLKKFNADLEERLTALRAQLATLSATWRDQEQKKFSEDFEEHMKVIGRYIEVTNEHAPFLLRKAERIEEYLQQR
jgi:WXG100 family type VII secretion target